MAGRTRAQTHRARDRLYRNVRDPRMIVQPVEVSEDIPEFVVDIPEPVQVEVTKCECLCVCSTYASNCSGDCCSCGA